MGTRDARVDAFIARSAEFARPILEHVREVVHAGCPTIEETIKWSFPFFCHRGRIICYMSAFKRHAAFGFYRGAQVFGTDTEKREAMGSFGRLTSVKDLPSRQKLIALVKRAVLVAEAGTGTKALRGKAAVAAAVKPAKPAKLTKPAKPALRTPAALSAALKGDAQLRAHWEAFAPSHRREYLEWILGAKLAPTRERRLATTIAQVREGKSQNWKYETRKK